MTLANAHALFVGLKSEASFKRKIHIDAGDPEDALLRNANRRIRSTLREAFLHVDRALLSEEGRRLRVAERDSRAIEKSARVRAIDVRFLRQGSFAYQTLVRPAQSPPQEIDLDDGVYVPVEFIDGQPIFSSAALFYVVEEALKPLLKEQPTWKLVRKTTCICIQLGGADAHIDLPLFAVEKSEFERVQQNFYDAFGEGARKAEHLNESRIADRDKHYRVPSEAIRLAHKEEDWISSDPKAFQDWLEDWVAELGPVTRRVSMYVKAWRDRTFPKSGLSSLAITVTTIRALEEIEGRPADSRDDEISLMVLRKLKACLNGEGIFHPNTGARLDGDVEGEERVTLLAAVDVAIQLLNSALNQCTNQQVVVRHFRSVFGDRFPNCPDAVKVDVASQASSMTEEKAARVPHPNVISSTSG